MSTHRLRASIFLIGGLVLAAIASIEFLRMREAESLIPGPGLSRTGLLSDYFWEIRGTNGDATAYYYEGEDPGATMLLLGGTHPNETAGYMAAVLTIENVVVKKGRLIVIPRANTSGFSATDPLEGSPMFFSVNAKSGARAFRYGSRGCNPLDQWPDPVVHLHYPSGQQLSGNETRNLNRCYPGKPSGTFMEKLGHAIMELLRKEQVDLAVDLHEAAPEIPIINAIVVHERARELGANAVLELELEGLQYSLEISPKNFRGLSHREWGDAIDVYPFLMETSNPIQGRLRGPTSSELILKGMDPQYFEASGLDRMRITYHPEGEPLEHRVGRHLQGLHAIIAAFNTQFPAKPLEIGRLPQYQQMIEGGVGAFLN